MPRKSDASGILRRGSACLSCRRRKLRCDGLRPVCTQCTTMKRAHECNYDDSARKSRTQTLREKLFALEAKVRELEYQPGCSSIPSSSSSSVSDSTPSPLLKGYDDLSSQFMLDPSIFPTDLTAWDPNVFDSMFTTSIPSSFPDDQRFDSPPFNFSVHSSPSGSDGSISLPLGGAVSSPSGRDALPPSANPIYFMDQTLYDGLPDRLFVDPEIALTPEVQHVLIRSFVDHRKQYCFYSNSERFDPSRTATTTGAIYQHQVPANPSLINAIHLLGCFFTRAPLPQGLEQHLLEQTLREVSRSLHNQEQLIDVVQALTLLAQYFFFNNRGMEANRHLSAAKRIALDLRLHQVSHPDLATFPFDLDYPFDSPMQDWKEKAAVFWQLFMVERFWATTNDCTAGQPELDSPCRNIATPLPVLDGAQMDTTLRNSTIRAFFDTDDDSFHASSLSVTAFKIMASSLFDRSIRVNNTTLRDNATWAYHRSAEVALTRLLRLVPPFLRKDAHYPSAPYFDTDLFTVHALIFASTIHLHLDNAMNLKASLAAKKLVELVNILVEDDYHYLDPSLAICLVSIIKLFRRMIESTAQAQTNGVGGSSAPYALAFLKRCVEILTSAVQNMSGSTPFADDLFASLGEVPAPHHSNISPIKQQPPSSSSYIYPESIILTTPYGVVDGYS
ncbi:unnamed protein product [Cyclocybe aegerita]|uniref:Zn(2)-C6 fungal-type domain-containing protein n=1 Tax=Cyclocybe aegerita TaxID=1973307 RepID=A0A8S0VXK2_CYCAE|nr:unnamed protein product [Cyclocybe aegerita]